MAEELLSELTAIRINREEAKKLEDLGEELKDAKTDPNKVRELRARRAIKRTERIKKWEKTSSPYRNLRKSVAIGGYCKFLFFGRIISSYWGLFFKFVFFSVFV